MTMEDFKGIKKEFTLSLLDIQDYIKRNLKDEPDLIRVAIQDDSVCEDSNSSVLLFEVYVNGSLYANYLNKEEASDLVIAIVDGYNLGKGIRR